MFPTKSNCFLKPKGLIGYIYHNNYYIKQTKSCLHTLETYNFINDTCGSRKHLHTLSCYNNEKFVRRDASNMQDNLSITHWIIYNRKLCKMALSDDADRFGELVHEKHERFPMDKDEEAEEKLAEKRVPKRLKVSHTDYYRALKAHLDEKNLELALNILDVMKENGDKPTLTIYKLLISGFSRQGDIKQCVQLYKQLRDRGLAPSPSIYTSFINVCAESENTEEALARLKILREYFHEKQIHINQTHYITLIKAYGRHKDTSTAFQLADEAKSKGIPMTNITAVLFHAIIADKENGLKYMYKLWHKMKVLGVKPNIYHYNNLLRTLRDAKFSHIKMDDILKIDSLETQTQVSETEHRDLFNILPKLNTSLISLLKPSENNELNDNNSEKYIFDKATGLCKNLNDTLDKNRLILLGGFRNILNQMKRDNVKPDVKTLTLLLDLLPPTLSAENSFLDHIKKDNAKLDITFFNVLIKRRCLRKDYNSAIKVLNEVQYYDLIPNVYTFGALSIGCTKHMAGKELLSQMDAIGYVANHNILETLLLNACSYKDCNYVLDIIRYTLDNGMKLSTEMLKRLEDFDKIMLEFHKKKQTKYSVEVQHKIISSYNKFKIEYLKLKQMHNHGYE